jgi:membrane protease YdiL (CAAX protease family)
LEGLARVFGLDPPLSWKDWRFFAAIGAGPLFWLALWFALPLKPVSVREIFSCEFFFLVFVAPVSEEALFRGVLQGSFRRFSWGPKGVGGISAANLATSVLFTFGHLWRHPPLWALSILIPSLLFGYFRDRTGSLYPSLTLHVYYNTGYFLLAGLPS